MNLFQTLEAELASCGLPPARQLLGKKFVFQGIIPDLGRGTGESPVVLISSITGITVEPTENGHRFPYEICFSVAAKMIGMYDVDHISCSIKEGRAQYEVSFRHQRGNEYNDYDLGNIPGQIVFTT